MTTTDARRDAFVERMFGSTVAAFELLGVYIGDQLGLYAALAAGPLSAPELAARTGIAPRYAREWLEHQAVAGILEVGDPAAAPDDRVFTLPAGHDEALLDESSLNFAAPFGQLLVACTLPIHALLDAYRTGEGVPYADYGADLHEGQARFTRPMFEHLLTQEWLPAADGLHQRLQADPPARVADVACGLGHSTAAIARGYPKVVVDGIDLDEASIARATELHAASGVEGRVSFKHADAADPGLAGRYDLVTIFEALHDMSDPIGVLRAIRGMLADGGRVLIGDELTADAFAPDSGDLERLYYGFSVTHCLPVGMVGEDPAGTGTVMRAATVHRYAEQAGFSNVEVLPIEHDFWRFYELRP
jgi:SAM-dependent methyltransferase